MMKLDEAIRCIVAIVLISAVFGVLLGVSANNMQRQADERDAKIQRGADK